MLLVNQQHSDKGQKATWVGVAVNAVLIACKLAGGIFGHSQALIADAVHSVSDLLTDIIVLVGVRIGRKAPDERHPFGHARIETLACALVGCALTATAVYLAITAAFHIYRHTGSHPTKLALVVAGISIVLKESLYHYTVRVGRSIKSRLIVANAWHHRSDSLSSVAVFVGISAALVNPSWHILDSFAALLVTYFIAKVGLEVLLDSLREFTDTAPPPETLDKIRSCARSVEGVIDMHDLRARTSGGLFQMEIHILVDGGLTVAEGHNIAKTVERCLVKEVEDFDRIIVHVDPATGEERLQHSQTEHDGPLPC